MLSLEEQDFERITTLLHDSEILLDIVEKGVDDREMETVLLLLMMSQNITKDQLLSSIEKKIHVGRNNKRIIVSDNIEQPFKMRRIKNFRSSNINKQNNTVNENNYNTPPELITFAPVHKNKIDEYYPIGSKIKKRQRTTPEQLRILEEVYTKEKMPNQSLRENLGKQLGMTSRRVQIWFQNKRAKEKRMKNDTLSRDDDLESKDRMIDSTSEEECLIITDEPPSKSLLPTIVI